MLLWPSKLENLGPPDLKIIFSALIVHAPRQKPTDRIFSVNSKSDILVDWKRLKCLLSQHRYARHFSRAWGILEDTVLCA